MQLSSESVVIITGASKGIGKATALRLAKYKCHIILIARTEALLKELAQHIEHIGARTTIIVGDLAKKKTSQMVADCVQKLQRIDVLINNAGHGYYAPIEDIEDKALENIFRTNILAPLWLSQKFMPMFKKQKFGHIVNISSIIGVRSIPGSSAYCMSKFALNALDESMALELEPFGVNVNLICPGLTQTDFQDNSQNAHLNPGLASKIGANPDSVARAIEHAIRYNKRRTYLTPWGKALVYLQRLSPNLADKLLLSYYKKRMPQASSTLSLTHTMKESS